MIDLHTHTIMSDGELLPAELARRVDVLGYRYLALTDHAGPSNLGYLIEAGLRAAEELNPHLGVVLIPGVELTHCPPKLIPKLTQEARSLGALWVAVHGETLVEPVLPGTNLAALEAGVDLLAHPGLLTEEEAELAARNGVALELSFRKGHSLTNGLVRLRAREAGAILVVDSDAHSPSDLMTDQLSRGVALGAGLSEEEAELVRQRAYQLAEKAVNRA